MQPAILTVNWGHFEAQVDRHTATFKASVREEYDGLLASAQEEVSSAVRRS